MFCTVASKLGLLCADLQKSFLSNECFELFLGKVSHYAWIDAFKFIQIFASQAKKIVNQINLIR
jgi:hypothetical protein